MNKIKKIVVIVIIFLGWNIWNNTIYDSSEQEIIEQIMFYLQGFKGFDKPCIGWILIHMPIQLYLSINMSRYLYNFSIYYYMKKGTIKKLWQEEIWISFKTAFSYYMIGLFCILLQMYSQEKLELLLSTSILSIIQVCLILALSAVTFTFFVLLLECFTINFQLAVSIAIVVQILMVMLSQNIITGVLWYPLSHTDIRNQLMDKSFTNLLLQSIIEIIAVAVIGFVATKKRFEDLIGCV